MDGPRVFVPTQQYCSVIPDQPVYTSGNHVSTVDPHYQRSIQTVPAPVSLATNVWPINDYMKGRLLSLHFRKTSKWCETTDSLRHYSIRFGHMTKPFSAFAVAATTLAATQEPLLQDHSEWVSEELHRFAVHTIQLCKLHSHEVLLATILLCFYCFYSQKFEAFDSHLQRLLKLNQERWNEFSDDLTYACFWAVARLGR